MKWNPEMIKALRLKLAWSRAEFGRRLGLSLLHIEDLERGQLSISEDIVEHLEDLSFQLDDYSKTLISQSQSEKTLKNHKKEQISDLELELLTEKTLRK
ncbi:MAG: multiprotein-bridging factor 1 family protein [Bdellovibrionales bacterium]